MPQALLQKVRTRRLDRLTWTASTTTTIDLKKTYNVENPIARLRFRFAFLVTAGGGGAVSGLANQAGVQLFAARMIVKGTHKDLGEHVFLDMAAPDLAKWWHQANDIIGKEQDFSDPTPAASATGSGRREFTIPFDSPFNVFPFASYVDPSDWTSLSIEITHGAAADYATTNLSTITAATFLVEVDEVKQGLAQGRAHFIPKFMATRLTIGAQTSTEIVLNAVTPGGYVPLFSLAPHDDSASGTAIVDIAGLIRRISAWHGDDIILDKSEWEGLALKTEQDFNKGFTTARRTGPITHLVDRDRNILGLIDGRGTSLQFQPDTSTAVPQGTTAVAAAAGDRLDTYILVWRPNAAMKEVLRDSGMAA